MVRMCSCVGFIAMGMLALSPLSPAQTPRRSHKNVQSRAPLPPLPPGPLSQLPMDQLPAAPPRVSYQDGLLTIVAQNSTLADILREVRKQTGASIDVPANATERVVTRLGPGLSRDVLASLLNGSAFNYVMLGSASDPTALSTVLLTQKAAGGAGGTAPNTPVAAASPPTPVFTPPDRGPVPVGVQSAIQPGANADNADDSADEEDAEDTEDQPGGQTDPNAQQGVTQPNAGPRTPEQILQMLQQQRAPGGRPPYVNPPNQPPNNQQPQQ